MLVLKRKEGQWVEVVHRSGDVLRLRVYGICAGVPGRVNIAFDDRPRHFEIRRPERPLPGQADAVTGQAFPTDLSATLADPDHDITPLDTTMPIISID